MGKLSFLSNLTLLENKPTGSAPKTTGATPLNPEAADLRLFKDGRIYPSSDLVKEFDLEYRPKSTKADQRGFGFDLVDSRKFYNYPKEAPAIMMLAALSKGESKVDLFGTTNYQADKETPNSSVLEQGAATRGKDLIEELVAIYGYESVDALFGEERFVDLKIVRQQPIKTNDDIYHVMKKVVRGPRKGEDEPVRRENLTLFPLIVKGGEYDEEAEGGSEVQETPATPQGNVQPQDSVPGPVDAGNQNNTPVSQPAVYQTPAGTSVNQLLAPQHPVAQVQQVQAPVHPVTQQPQQMQQAPQGWTPPTQEAQAPQQPSPMDPPAKPKNNLANLIS